MWRVPADFESRETRGIFLYLTPAKLAHNQQVREFLSRMAKDKVGPIGICILASARIGMLSMVVQLLTVPLPIDCLLAQC